MSNWTQISGSLGLERSPFNYKLNKDGSIQYHKGGYYDGYAKRILPYPEEQAYIRDFTPFHRKSESKDPLLSGVELDGFKMDLEITSFPIIKREIESLMKVLPSGEWDVIQYNLFKDRFCRTGSSDFESPQTEKIFKTEALKKVSAWGDWKEYTRYTPIELGIEDHQGNSTLTIQDSIRYCTASELHPCVMDFLRKIVDKGILFDHGFLYYRDDYLADEAGEEYFVKIESDRVDVTVFNHGNNTKRREYYQIIGTDKSTEEKKYPWKHTLKRVSKFTDDYWVNEEKAPETLDFPEKPVMDEE